MPTAVSASEFILERQNQNNPRIWGGKSRVCAATATVVFAML